MSTPRSAETLAQGYSRGMRALEVFSIVSFLGLVSALAFKLWRPALDHPVQVAVAGFLGFLAADLVSGLVHWLADTWGSPELPVIGPSLIRPFRHHHVDPLEITRHDFVETNGANCLISLPVAAAALLIATYVTSGWGLFVATFLGSLVAWVMGTNQFHKWSHTEVPPRPVMLMQRLGVILPAKHHALHHSAPYDRNYCITVGWWNRPLNAIGFFRGMERLITRVTGHIPRADDLQLPKG